MWVQTLRCIPWFPSPATPASFPGGEAGVGGGGVFRVGCSCCFRVAGSWIVSVSVCIIIEFVVYLINIGLKRCCCLFFFLFFFGGGGIFGGCFFLWLFVFCFFFFFLFCFFFPFGGDYTEGDGDGHREALGRWGWGALQEPQQGWLPNATHGGLRPPPAAHPRCAQCADSPGPPSVAALLSFPPLY